VGYGGLGLELGDELDDAGLLSTFCVRRFFISASGMTVLGGGSVLSVIVEDPVTFVCARHGWATDRTRIEMRQRKPDIGNRIAPPID
jgi:hypothetical protein